MASLTARRAAEDAVGSIGLGYDIADDLRLKRCKRTPAGLRLIAIDETRVRNVPVPGGISIPNVPLDISCDKGERVRFSSDVLSFQQMSEHFNQDLSLSGKIPSGQFNSAFGFSGCWQKDAANTKALAIDGIFITYYSIALEKSQAVLHGHVKEAVPSTWDPAALARFIEKFGTHVIVGVKMGGKDVIYVKQHHSSSLQPEALKIRLKDIADAVFIDASGQFHENYEKRHAIEKLEIGEHKQMFMDTSTSSTYSQNKDFTVSCKRRGGNTSKRLPHRDWCLSVQSEPDVISMSFVPITSLLNGIEGSGYLSHAINLYLRYKPPIQELHSFLEFQLPSVWAPVFGELLLGPQKKLQSAASLQFNLWGPKLYVNTSRVDVGKRPVTGLRLYLEGRKSNCLAIHLQHLSSLPKLFQLQDEQNSCLLNDECTERSYYEKVRWKRFSHVCTAPVESGDELSIVTGANFEVSDCGFKGVLFLRLHFSKVIGAVSVRMPEWDGPTGLPQRSGIISTLISTHFTTTVEKPPPRPSDVVINSALYPNGPPQPIQAPKLLRYIDMTERKRGPQDTPGYWVVSGARLVVDKGKIALRVKYSLLTPIIPEDEDECSF